ncbi:MAG: Crp/Fnr family transcriptional regulator [Breznakia sp.]
MHEIKNHEVFNNITTKEFEALHAFMHTKNYAKGSILFHMGEEIHNLYIIIRGEIEICSYDINGNKKLVTLLSENDMFAESVALGKHHRTPFDIIATKNLRVLEISSNAIFQVNTKISQNIISILATKNAFLTHKIECLNKITIKERIFEVLTFYCVKRQSYSFKLPFNKTQLAEYLCVNRSSLSRELSQMEKKGIFRSDKQTYHLNTDFFKML